MKYAKKNNKGNLDVLDLERRRSIHGIVRGTMEGRKKMFGKEMLSDISYLIETYTTCTFHEPPKIARIYLELAPQYYPQRQLNISPIQEDNTLKLSR